MRDLLLVVPSRSRPGNVARLAEAMRETCRGDTQLLVGLDADDPALPEYEALAYPEVQSVVEPGLRYVVPWINHLAVPNASAYRYVGHIGDDNVPRTVGWDVRVAESLARHRTSFCFADDLYPGRVTGSLCCHVFMTTNVVRLLGYMGPPSIQHMYVDPVWMAWGKATHIEFLADVVVEHMHYTCGKAPGDESYNGSTALIPPDCDRYNAYCAEGLRADIAKLGGAAFDVERFNFDLNIPCRWGDPSPWATGQGTPGR